MQPCPGLVECIEAGELDSPATRDLLQELVAPLLSAGCDTLILGCTHYPFIKPLLRQLVPQSVSLIDTGEAVARQLQRVLSERSLLSSSCSGHDGFWSSGNIQRLAAVLPALWGQSGPVAALVD
jgi:glutamate racemase